MCDGCDCLDDMEVLAGCSLMLHIYAVSTYGGGNMRTGDVVPATILDTGPDWWLLPTVERLERLDLI